MDAVFLVLMGVGGYLMFAAYKGEAPFTQAVTLLGSASSTTAPTAPKG